MTFCLPPLLVAALALGVCGCARGVDGPRDPPPPRTAPAAIVPAVVPPPAAGPVGDPRTVDPGAMGTRSDPQMGARPGRAAGATDPAPVEPASSRAPMDLPPVKAH